MTSSPITSATPAAPVRPSTTPGTAVAPPISGAVTAAAPLAGKAEVSKPSESTKGAPVATSDAQLPGESNTIILSSKGAEKRLAHSVPPKYPAEARDTQGTVVLKAVIDEDGKVDDLRLVEGNATLSAAAIQAVKQWRYRPYVRDGKALPFQTIIIVDFQRP
jgi:protein TonB